MPVRRLASINKKARVAASQCLATATNSTTAGKTAMDGILRQTVATGNALPNEHDPSSRIIHRPGASDVEKIRDTIEAASFAEVDGATTADAVLELCDVVRDLIRENRRLRKTIIRQNKLLCETIWEAVQK